jgi:hypothetical protein
MCANQSGFLTQHVVFGCLMLHRDCRGLFGKYDRIKALHHARHNLGVTAHLVEFFYTIPQKARAVSAMCIDNSTCNLIERVCLLMILLGTASQQC